MQALLINISIMFADVCSDRRLKVFEVSDESLERYTKVIPEEVQRMLEYEISPSDE